MIKETKQKSGLLVNKYYEYQPDPIKGDSAFKKEAKEKLETTHNTVPYNTDTESLVYMNAITNLANFKFIQALVANDPVALQPLYDAVYKSTIEWKGADNVAHTVQLESLAEAIETAMTKLATEVIKV